MTRDGHAHGPGGRAIPWHARRRRRRAVLRGLLAVTAAGAAAAALGALTRSAWTATTVDPGPADAVQVTALALATVTAAWLALVLALTTWTLLPGVLGVWGRRAGALVAPLTCLRLAALLVGTGLVGSTAAAPGALSTTTVSTAAVSTTAASTVLSAAPSASGGPAPLGTLPAPSFQAAGSAGRSGDPASSCLPRPGWRPARAQVRRHTSDVSLVSGCAADDDPVRLVVRRGDSLWQIAARHLGPDASAAEVARAWPRWYAANRQVIGTDPDLLLPGQVLTAPEEAG